MRILVINWRDIRNPEAGGAEVHLHETFSRIAAWGNEVTLLCSRFPGAADSDQIDGIDVIRHGGKWTFNFTAPWYYRRHLAHRSFDVVIEDLNKIPALMPWFLDGPPLMVLLHHLFGTTFYREINPVLATYLYFMERLIPLVYRRCLFEAVSESTRDELVRMGVAPDRISVVHNGLDPRFLDSGNMGAPAASDRKEPGLVIYLGRLKKYKNVDHLIQAMAIVREKVPDARLVIVGEGDRRRALEALTRSMGLDDAVRFTGFVSEDEKLRLLTRAEVAAYPSSKEGWGITVIEANACCVPVVAARVPGLRDAVVDGETGVLVPLGDREAMARALIDLLHDREKRERLAGNAVARSRLYTWENTARETLQVIRRSMGESTDVA
ncbi:MAG: glycosyltransferase family 4 protein [Gemmatimonadetes bacterium]|nr:glycosyltransferase family 4 protein [Gemmatimonadota bacterium]MYH20353.1 glycosyltransferase family 4 protein [Gemmatimonadota bacterium]MYK97777.1 glycosyltransferase family 4 protein [Gemmatimonadota bacterium]